MVLYTVPSSTFIPLSIPVWQLFWNENYFALGQKSQVLSACLQFPALSMWILCGSDSLMETSLSSSWFRNILQISEAHRLKERAGLSWAKLSPHLSHDQSYLISCTDPKVLQTGQRGREHKVTDGWNMTHSRTNSASQWILHSSLYLPHFWTRLCAPLQISLAMLRKHNTVYAKASKDIFSVLCWRKKWPNYCFQLHDRSCPSVFLLCQE
jgi:hypothetical protein